MGVEYRDNYEINLHFENNFQLEMRFLSKDANENSCFERIRQQESNFTEASKKIAGQIISSPDTIVHMTVCQAAEFCATSEASIVRFCKALGYNGYSDFKIFLASELSLVTEPMFSLLEPDDDDADVLQKVFAAEIKALQDTAAMIDEEAFKLAVDCILSARKVEFYAFGNSRPITFDVNYRMLKIGVNSYVGIDIDDSLMHANMLEPGDVAVAVSHTGSTKYTCMALEAAHGRGARTICITAFPHSPITRVSDICLFAAAIEEFDFQCTTVASKTAEMAIMDALYTAVAFRKGESAKQYIKFTDRIVYVERY